MRRFIIISLSVMLLILGIQLSVAAEELDQLFFDIFVDQELITVLFNLSPYLTSERIQNLKDGRRFVLEIESSLKRPRKIWGSELTIRKEMVLAIEYQIVTESYRLNIIPENLTRSKKFVSLARLHRYLSDSVILPMISVDSIDQDFSYQLEIKLSCITSGLIPKSSKANNDEKVASPIRYLFGKFLDLTGYGRQDYEAISDPFRLEDLTQLK